MKRGIVGLLFTTAAWGQCSGYLYQSTFTIAQTTANLTAFPVVIPVTDTNLKSASNGGTLQSAQGFDVCWSNSGNTAILPWQYMKGTALDTNTGSATFVVSTNLSASAATAIKLWTGNPAVAATTASASSVFDANYKGVYHLQESGPPYADDSASDNTASATAAPARAAGQIGYAQQFTAASAQYIQLANNITSGTTVTWEALVQPTTNAASKIFFDNRGNAGLQGMTLYVGSSCRLNGYANALNNTPVSAASLCDGVWHHAAAVLNAGVVTIYLDGVSVGASMGGSFVGFAAGTAYIGQIQSSNYYNGLMQEVRISNTNRSAAWIAAGSANLLTPAAFVSQGSWSTTATGPAISNLMAYPTSPNGILLSWTTSAPASSQVMCGPPGGPYPYTTTVVDPVKAGNPFYGVTNHALAVTGMPTNTTPGAYGCKAQSMDTSMNVTTSGEVTSQTLAALTSQPYKLIQYSAPIRYNDQYTGQNGMPANGRYELDDSLWCAWAADGNEYCAMNDCLGAYGASGSGGYNTGIFRRASAGLNITVLGALSAPNNTGPNTSFNYPSTYTQDGGRAYLESIGSPGDGFLYAVQTRAGGSVGSGSYCTTIDKSADYWETNVGNKNNTGPAAATQNFNANHAGIFDYPTAQAGCAATFLLVPWWLRLAQDYGGPWTGSGWTNAVTHQGGTEQWYYALAPYASAGKPVGMQLIRIMRADMKLTDGPLYQGYIGTGTAPQDVFDNTKWVPYTGAYSTTFTQIPFSSAGRKCQPHFIAAPVNRYWLTCWTYTAADPDAGVGIQILDIGASLTNFANGSLIGFVPMDKATWPHYGPVFPELMLNTLKLNDNGTISIRLSTTGNYRYNNNNPGVALYTAVYRDLVFAPNSPHSSRMSVGPGARRYPSGNLEILYTFDPSESSTWDLALPNHSPAPSKYAPSVAANSWVQSSLGGEFGVYGELTQTLKLATGYSSSDTDFTIGLLLGHNQDLSPVPPGGECVFYAADLSLCRNGTTANSWNLMVKGTAIGGGPFSLTTDNGRASLAMLFVRKQGSTVNVYQRSGITGLPLTPLATDTVSGALGGNPLYLGAKSDSTQPFYGTMAMFAFSSAALSDTDMLRAAYAVQNLAAARGITIP